MKKNDPRRFYLSFSNTFSYEVVVSFNNHHHIGKLKATKKHIYLSFTSESDGKCRETFSEHYDEIKCKRFNQNFLLLNLDLLKCGTGVLDHAPNNRGFFTALYSVEYVISHRSDFFDKTNIMGCLIKSKDITNWVGNTNKQQKIIDDYYKQVAYESFENTEFSIDIDNTTLLGCYYPIKIFGNSPKQKAGIKFNPLLFIRYRTANNIINVIEDIKSITCLFSFCIGKDIGITKIKFEMNEMIQVHHPTLFFIPEQTNANKIKNTGVLFPLSTNLRFNLDGLPEFPLSVFQKYYLLSNYKKEYFNKYLSLSRMSTSEDKFLSIFRIVEKMSFVEESYFSFQVNNEIALHVKNYLKSINIPTTTSSGYLNKLKKINNTKFNTESNIKSIFKTIMDVFPDEIKNNNKLINDMVKLRNDITHLNEYYVSENVLLLYISFLNIIARYQLMGLLEIDESIRKRVLLRMPDNNRLRYLASLNERSW